MGKLGPRLDSRKNAKRWPKGQSSSSNPETKKYREQAAWMFLKDTSGIIFSISYVIIFYKYSSFLTFSFDCRKAGYNKGGFTKT